MDECARILADAHGPEHVGRLERRRGAGRARRHRHVLDRHHQRLALDVGEGDVEVPGEPVLEAAVHGEEVEPRREPLPQLLAEREDARRLGVALDERERGGLAEPDDPRDVQGPGAEAALVPAAVHLRDEADARLAADVQRPDALRPVHLVGGERDEVGVRRLHVEGDLPDRLDRVAVEEDPRRAGDPAELLDRVDDPRLVVRVHHRDEDGVLPQRRPEALGVEAAVPLDVEEGDLEALPLERVHRVEHRLVLGLAGDEVAALLPVELGGALDREVVRLRGAARPDDLPPGRSDQAPDLRPGRLDGLLGAPPHGVTLRGRVPELLGEMGEHDLEDARIHRGRRVVIEVDRNLHRARNL